MEKNLNYIINKTFTVPYIDKMISEKAVSKTFYEYSKPFASIEDSSYRTIFSNMYCYMNKQYRNEYYFKNTILNKLLLEKHDISTTAALSELPISTSIADFVLINGKGIVYEIKTDLDNLNRLSSQINDYYKVFSYVYVVVSKKQLIKVKEYLDGTPTGIYELTRSGNLLCRKKAMCYKNKLSHKSMFLLMRKYEFEQTIFKHFGKLPNVNNFIYYRECLKWIKKMNILTLQKEVMAHLKRRTLLSNNIFLNSNIPDELNFYIYFSKKYRTNQKEVSKFLDKKMEVY